MRLLFILLCLLAFEAQAAAPVASCTPSRTSGVAPLAVFMDCTASTDADTSAPFHDLEFRHHTGDSNAGRWTYGAKQGPKYQAFGPVAAFVYETAGTYTWTAQVCDGTSCATHTSTITVSAPNTTYSGTATVCVNTSAPTAGADGCPTGAATATASDFCTAVGANIGTTKRVLFRRGVTFACAAKVTITADGPWTIGAYGAGTDRAVVSTVQTAGIIVEIGAGAGVFPDDGRIMDLEFTQSAGADTTSILGVGNFDKLTLLNLKIHNIGDGPQFYAGQVNVSGNDHIWDSLFIVGSIIQNINGGSATHGIYAFATKLAILGNLIDDTLGAEHLIRLDYCSKCVVSNNTLSNGAASKESIGLRGVGQDAGDSYYFQYVLPTPSPTQYVVISENKNVINAFAGLKVGPVNDATNTTIQNVISERNWYSVSSSLASILNNPIIIQGDLVTIRNELLDLSGSTRHDGVLLLAASTGMAAASNVNIFNNTFYSSTNGTGNVTLGLGSTGTTGTFKNNLAYFPAESGTVTVTVLGTWTAANNSTGVQAIGTNPQFSGVLTTPLGFAPAAASYATDGGTASGVPPSALKSDFFGCFDKTGDNRLGAIVPRAQAQCRGVAGP